MSAVARLAPYLVSTLMAGCSSHSAIESAPGVGMVIDHTCVDATDRVIPVDFLDKARRTNVVFGHESVGFNVVQGLERLARENPRRYGLAIGHQIQSSWYSGASGLGEFFVGNMANVPGKARAFEDRLSSGVAQHVKVATLKLCWADLQPQSDAMAAWNTYRDVMEATQKKYPNVTVVWWTMPLRREAQLQEKRSLFNAQVRAYAKTHPIALFDVADVESHRPDGVLATNDAGTPALYEGYASDGGHLNEEGSKRVARAWWWMMARISGWPGR